MLDLTKYGRKPEVITVGVITFAAQPKEIKTQNGSFTVQEFAMESFYGTVEKPYVETIVFQATSKPSRGFNKETQKYEDRPSYVEQFKEKPLCVGDVVSVSISASGYVGTKEGNTYTIPKMTLEKLWRLFGDEKTLIADCVRIAKDNRAAAAI